MYTDDEILEYKLAFFNDLFQLVPVKKGKTIGSKLKCTNEMFENHIMSQRVSKFYKLERNDYIAQVAFVCYEAILKFDVMNFDYQQLVNKRVSELNILFTYLKSAVRTRMADYNAMISDHKVESKGLRLKGNDRKYYREFHRMHVVSYDIPNQNGEGSKLENLIENNNLYQSNQHYELPFLKWFRDNKIDLLIKEHHKTLYLMEKYIDDFSVDWTQYGYKDRAQFNNSTGSIKKKVVRRWAKVKDELDIPFVEQHKKRELDYWSELIELIERSDLNDDELRRTITNHVSNRIRQDNKFSDFMYDNFDSRTIVKAMMNEPFNNEFIYQLYQYAEMKIIELNRVDYSNVISFSEISERNRVQREEAEKLKDKQKEFDELKIYYVYTLSPTGVLIPREEYDDEDFEVVEEN